MRVEQLMSKTVHTCSTGDNLSRAAQLMWEHDCGCVPVVDTDQHVIGIITDRDVAMAAYLQGRPLSESCVGDAMTREIHACRPSDNITAAEEQMRMFQVRRLPVTEMTGRLVGLISLKDLALEAANEHGLRRHEIPRDKIADTLADISRHRAASLSPATPV